MAFKAFRRCRALLRVLFLAALFLSLIHGDIFANESEVSRRIDTNFVEWSNSIPEEQAKIQLQHFLSDFDSIEQVREWLAAKGFSVEEPRPMNEHVAAKARKDGWLGEGPAYIFVAGWDVRHNGVILESNPLSRRIAKSVYYGVSIAVTYTNDFGIQRITITRSSL